MKRSLLRLEELEPRDVLSASVAPSPAGLHVALDNAGSGHRSEQANVTLLANIDRLFPPPVTPPVT